MRRTGDRKPTGGGDPFKYPSAPGPKPRPLTLLIILLSALFLAACATNPITTSPTQPQEIILKIDSNQPIDHINVKNDQEGDGISRSMEVQNTEGKLSDLTFILDGRAFMVIFSYLGSYDQKNVWNDFIYLENKTDIRRVDLYISSGGGSAFDGLGISDQLERFEKRGFEVVAHASGLIASAAVPIFAVCSERIASPGTMFMVHETSMFKWGRETASDIRSQHEMIELLRERYIDKLVRHSKVTKAQWEDYETRTTWFNTDKALEYGLVDRIE